MMRDAEHVQPVPHRKNVARRQAQELIRPGAPILSTGRGNINYFPGTNPPQHFAELPDQNIHVVDYEVPYKYISMAAPVWLDMVLENYIQPAAVAAGVTKNFAWHTFRRSLSTALSDLDVPVKVISELLRNATLSTTFELYQQASAPAKRAAQNHMKDLFAA